MDPATVIALCKENIQPLRHGRNVSQLGTALRAQDDSEAQQLLLQEKQMFDDAIKNYVGDDPLENWYEYISWVEQSYPKSGHDSPLNRLLSNCLTNFEKETKYHQDRRFIRLWINYINMQKNPLELYQLLYNNGIGTMVADMYRAWAFELEQVEDYKRADEIYMIGLSCRAEPREELEFAHKNFQLAVARKMLGRSDERNEISLAEQRQAFSSLKAIKGGKKVGSVRTGHRVRDYMPGAMPQTNINSQKPNAGIQIYQDDEAGTEGKGSSILDHVPIEQAVHKENTIKPGPWNNAIRKQPLIPTTTRTAFKVHEDTDETFYEKVRLFPNHVPFYDDSKLEDFDVPVFVEDIPNPNIILKCHYPKDLVYFQNQDKSMEQIRAEKYFERKRQESENTITEHSISSKMNDSRLLHEEAENVRLLEEQRRRLVEHQMELERQKQYEEQQRLQSEQLELERQHRDAEMKRQMYIAEQKRLEAEQIEQQRIEAERIEQERIDAERIEQERIEAERLESERMENELKRQQTLHAQSYLSQHHSSTADEHHFLGQSMTVNTKEAMSAMQDLWQSPDSRGSQVIQSPVMPRVQNVRNKLAFDVHMDSSMTQHVMMSNKHQSYITPMQSYNDQENHHYQNSYSSHEQQQPTFGNHSVMQNSYHYPMQSQHDHHPHLQSPPQQHHHHSQHQSIHQQHMQSPLQQNHHSMMSSHQSPVQSNHQSMMSPHQSPLQSNHQSIMSPHHHHSTHVNMSPHSNHIHVHHSPHLPHHSYVQHHSAHIQQQQQQQHYSPTQMAHNHQHMQHGQHSQQHIPQHTHHHQMVQHHMNQHFHQQPQQHMYSNMVPNNMGYMQQQYASAMPQANTSMETVQKQVADATYHLNPDVENKSYRMPNELPLIKSPGMNRKDLKYLENADNKENSIGVDFNGPTEEIVSKQDANNIYIDESLGITPLPGANETCYTENFNRINPMYASTPMTNQFKPYKVKEMEQQYVEPPPPPPPPAQPSPSTVGIDRAKLSVIMESTREYVSSSSASSGANTRNVFASEHQDLPTIKEQQSGIEELTETSSYLDPNAIYEQKMRAQIQAVNAQSPGTVQRNVDQITSEIKNSCDLRKSITFNSINENEVNEVSKCEKEPVIEDVNCNQQIKDQSMDCEYPSQEPMEEAEEEVSFKLPKGDINPFDKNLLSGLLKSIKFPLPHHENGYIKLNTNLNKFVPSVSVTLGNDHYDLDKCLGKGTYGTVFKGSDLQTRKVVALKTQKPAWVWEYYIAREIKNRLTNPHMLRGFMDVQVAYIANNGSVLVSEFSKYGTLLEVTNKIKVATGKPLSEPLAVFFTIEMLQIVEYLHKCQIIHADIKPDNFLLMHMPLEDIRPTIQLIDFGCSIDMRLFPEGTTFTQIIKTEDFTCVEMQTGKPWTYQTDLYCLAASSHCLLFGNYMRISKSRDKWCITSKLPRYAKKAVWEKYFTELLNIESCESLPDLAKHRNMMEEALSEMPELQSKYRHFSNVLNRR